MNAFRVAVLLFVSAVAASFAEGTNTLPTTITIDGLTYSNVTWRTVTPATVSILHATGAASIPLEKLPPELQKRFSYDLKKAADFRAAERSKEAARQEALRKRRAEEAETQKQAAEEEAKRNTEATAAKQAAEAASKKAARDYEARFGPVTQLRFSYSTLPKQLPDGIYCANLVCFNSSIDGRENIYVEFPPAGLNFMNACCGYISPGNGYSVYGRPYTANLQNAFGATLTETAYRLVGVNIALNGYPTW